MFYLFMSVRTVRIVRVRERAVRCGAVCRVVLCVYVCVCVVCGLLNRCSQLVRGAAPLGADALCVCVCCLRVNKFKLSHESLCDATARHVCV